MVMKNLTEDSGNGFEMGKHSEWFSIGLENNAALRGTQRPFLRTIFLKHPESLKPASETAYDTLSGYTNLKEEEMSWLEGNWKW
jgi:hypothetical protein